MGRDDVLRRDLERVRRGVKSRATGIRKCPACKRAYVVDIPARVMRLCPDCRPATTFTCSQCRTPFDGNREGCLLCPCCRIQPPLFEE